jgi:hypothetical protein
MINRASRPRRVIIRLYSIPEAIMDQPPKKHGGPRTAGPGKKMGRPERPGPKSKPIWCGQITEDERELIIDRLTPEERLEALLAAARAKSNK